MINETSVKAHVRMSISEDPDWWLSTANAPRIEAESLCTEPMHSGADVDEMERIVRDVWSRRGEWAGAYGYSLLLKVMPPGAVKTEDRETPYGQKEQHVIVTTDHGEFTFVLQG